MYCPYTLNFMLGNWDLISSESHYMSPTINDFYIPYRLSCVSFTYISCTNNTIVGLRFSIFMHEHHRTLIFSCMYIYEFLCRQISL
ncbi:hypothetical protein OIU79_003585 [Salix purpurea]|uniref:Uncharacterized protein n=1 Tax=Salix purpurea TaxID=77065 RepID=A0A9Q0ULS2_SALPP|nr:hypothetical protein OIU79_003585 [Salix purpurea]